MEVVYLTKEDIELGNVLKFYNNIDDAKKDVHSFEGKSSTCIRKLSTHKKPGISIHCTTIHCWECPFSNSLRFIRFLGKESSDFIKLRKNMILDI